MTTLPTGIPRLDALVRAEAARLAAESAAAQVIAIRARHLHDAFGSDLIAALPPGWVYRDSHEALLRDLGRRESRDWAACALAGLVGVTVGATTPNWYWTDRRSDSTDRDGAPNGDGWPAGWWLSNDIGDMRFFSAEDWCPDGDSHTHVPDLPNGRENAAPALAKALAAVCRDG